jgi:hypothetical protein
MRGYQQLSPPAFARILPSIVCFLTMRNWAFAQQSVFDEEVIGKWKAYEVFSHGLQESARGSGTLLNGKPRTFVAHYKQNRECASFNKDMSDPSFENWFIYNPRYAASIKRNKESPTNVFLLKYESDPNAPIIGGASIDARFFWETSPHFCCCGLRLSQLVSNPDFSARIVGKEFHDGRELIRLDYDYVHLEQKTSMKTEMHGSTYFDPSRRWCIYQDKSALKRITQGTEWETEHDDRYETIDHTSGFPIMKRWTRNTKRTILAKKQSKQETATAITDYEWEINDHAPNNEFTLSAFGLPEPMGFEPPPQSRMWLWLLAAAVIAALAAILFAWLKQRRTKAAPRLPTAS